MRYGHGKLTIVDADRRKRIVFLIGSMEGGGAARVFVTLLRHLDRNHFKPYLVLLRAEGELMCQLPQDVVVLTLHQSWHYPTLVRFFPLMRNLVQVIRRIRPQAVLSTGGMNLALVLARPGLPRGTKVLIREGSVLDDRLNTDSRYPRLWRSIYRNIYQWADKVVCLSDSMVTEMSEKFNLRQQRSIRIYNPIDLNLVQELGRSGGSPYSGAGPQLVAAGRLSHEKGFDLLLAAMPKVIECLPQARLTILGRGPLRAALAEQIQTLGLSGSVGLVGFQQNPWPYVYHADLFVLSSRRESFGNTLLEALALETPAVAIDCPGAIREIYGSNPAVRIVPAGDAASLAEAIVAACSADKHERVIPKPSQDWFAKFALTKVLDEYSALFLADKR
jgi:glycosyltransferase involved in cell wall biosynthesis